MSPHHLTPWFLKQVSKHRQIFNTADEVVESVEKTVHDIIMEKIPSPVKDLNWIVLAATRWEAYQFFIDLPDFVQSGVSDDLSSYRKKLPNPFSSSSQEHSLSSSPLE